MRRRTVIYILASVLIILWIYAAGSKLSNFGLFLSQLKRQPVPEWSLHFLQIGIPAIEVLAALLLCFKKSLMIGFTLSILLMATFTLYIGFGLVNVYGSIPCSCGGVLGRIGWVGHLNFNIFFLIISVVGWYLLRNERKEEKNRLGIIS